jgi:hypothetical protein
VRGVPGSPTNIDYQSCIRIDLFKDADLVNTTDIADRVR